MYDGGHTYLESVPIESGYADVIFRLSEKTSSGVSIKYLLPGEGLRPENLITISDNADLQVIPVSANLPQLGLEYHYPSYMASEIDSYRHLSDNCCNCCRRCHLGSWHARLARCGSCSVLFNLHSRLWV